MSPRALFVRLNALAGALFFMLGIQGAILVYDGPVAAGGDEELAWLALLDSRIDGVLRLWSPLAAVVVVLFLVAAYRLHHEHATAIRDVRLSCAAGAVWALGFALHFNVATHSPDHSVMLQTLLLLASVGFAGGALGCLLFLYKKSEHFAARPPAQGA